jgi:hypothetical protein
VNWSFSGPLSGRTATATDRSDGPSTLQSCTAPEKLPRSPFCPTSARYSTASAGYCPSTSSLWAYPRRRSAASLGP